MWVPSVITMCVLCRATRNPAFCKARTASRWLIPGSLGMLDGHFDPADPLILEEFRPHFEILADRLDDIRERLLFGRSLRAASRQARHGDAEAFFRLDQCDLIRHRGPLGLSGPSHN